jgi:uncharacterized cupredoxin-like copper-binding protein
MTVLRRGLVALTAFIGMVIVAGSALAAPATATVEISIHWSHYQPTLIHVRAGQRVTFVLRNDDPIDHEWILGDEGVQARHRTGIELSHGARPTEQTIPAGTEVHTTITFDTQATLQYICHLPGHEAYGMVGTLVVDGS